MAKPTEWVSRISGDPYKPNFGDMSSYPNTIVVGDELFPLLYIYFIGDSARIKRVTNRDLFNRGLKIWADASVSNNTLIGQTSENIINNLNIQVSRFSSMLEDALNKNDDFVWNLKEKVNGLLATHKSRIPHIDINTTGGKYYKLSDRQVASRVPVMLDAPSFQTADAALETLRILVENQIIDPNYTLGIRPINLQDGQFAEEDPSSRSMKNKMREIGLPSQGSFTANKVPKSSWMYHTHSGIDITVIASVGDIVSPLEGLTTLSWSIHRGKQTQRPLGKESPSGRSKGTRTIAGSMVFAASDHHPLHKIVPHNYPVGQSLTISRDPQIWKPLLMADELPPFDIVLVAQNEYGFGSMVSIYGMEITDEGTTVGIDNLITEIVIQYTAVAMDPIQEIAPTEQDGVVDPFGLYSVRSSNIYRRRESIIAGAGYSDLEEQWHNHNDGIYREMMERSNALKSGKYRY